MEVKALFDKYQKNKKVIKAKKVEGKGQQQAEESKPQTQGHKAKKVQKSSTMTKRPDQRKKSPRRDKKKTEEGFQVYTEEELRLGDAKAGETPDCPFDCDCCY